MFELGPFQLDPDAGILTHDDRPVELGPRAIAVLKTLVEHAHQHVPKQRILDSAWPGRVVEEANLAVQISAIRRALARAPGGDRWIETLARRGYRFVGPVSRCTRTLRAKRTNLTFLPDSFIGRERELAAIGEFLRSHRLVTLVGPGGIGKTRLAQEVASAALRDFADGTWFVDLAVLEDDARVAAAVAEALQIEQPPSKPALDTLRDELRDRSMLLVLDNCEHVAQGCARFAEALLHGCAAVRILATSRESLRVKGEQVASLDPLSSEDATRLFVDRAREHLPDFDAGEREPLVSEICTHLDGIPLAIELAAARTRSLSVEQIHARLGDRFRLLTAGPRAATPRHQTLRAALEWSFDLLGEAERNVLRRLGVFAGGFTLEAAAAVASCKVLDEHAVIDIVLQLVSRSLVAADTREAGGRYRLLETMRAFALEKLTEAGEVEAVRDRHARFFAAHFADEPEEFLRLPDARILPRYTVEVDNVRQALDWAFADGNDAQLGLALLARTYSVWLFRGLWREGSERLEAATARLTPATPPLDAGLLWLHAGMHWPPKPPLALERFERALPLLRASASEAIVAHALLHIASPLARTGRLAEARAALEEALPLVERSRLPKLLAVYHGRCGYVDSIVRDLVGAREHWQAAIRHIRECGADHLMIWARNALGDVLWGLGELDDALAVMRETAETPRLGRGLSPTAQNLANLAGVHVARGELAEALKVARRPHAYPYLFVRDNAWAAVDHLALRLLLVGKTESGALLAGYADASYAARKAMRLVNETRARERIDAILHERLDPAQIARLLAEGGRLGNDEARRLALEE